MMFCFFKQKTAYDMRISDWSSDVCSSDLAFLPRARSTSRQASLGDRCRSGRPDQLPQAGPARPDGRTRWSCLNRPFAMPEPVHAWKFLNQPIFAQETATNPAKRSEAHTSELQSLMRISYAVFCLKKKKKS